MKHIKTFEELKPGTYFSAADKLDKKGHSKRSDNLYDHGKSKMVSKTPFNFTIWFSPNGSNSDYPSFSRLNPRGWVATREEANHIFQICKEMGIKDVKVNDLYKEGVDKDPKMQSFTAEFKPKFKTFVNIDEIDFSKNSVRAKYAIIGTDMGRRYSRDQIISVTTERKSNAQTTAPADVKTEIKNKGFIQKVGDFFGKGSDQRIH